MSSYRIELLLLSRAVGTCFRSGVEAGVVSNMPSTINNLNIKSLIKNLHKNTISLQKDVKYPPSQPSTDLCQKIVSKFYADTAPEVFEEVGCAVCKMEQLSNVENINLLKVWRWAMPAKFGECGTPPN